MLVYDFGGGTLDVTVIEIKTNYFTTKAISGDVNLGGEDVDNSITNYFRDILEKQTGKDLNQDQGLGRTLAKFKKASNDLKI